MTSNFVPGSLQRIRRFLADKGRFKVKPWADVETTLEAFRTVLFRNRNDDAFWDELESLLSQLCEDAQKRVEGNKIGLIQNEVLNPNRRNQLVGEIRRAIAIGSDIDGGFRALSNQLSTQAFALLLILGSTTTVGCYASQRNDPDAKVAEDSGSEEEDSATEIPTEGTNAANAGAGGTDQTKVATGGMDTSQAATGGFSNGTVDAGVPIDAATLPDYSKAPSPGTLEEMAEACMPEATELRQEVFQCIDALHESWRIGLTKYFRDNNCYAVQTALEMLGGEGSCEEPPSPCADPANAGEFDVDAVIDHCYCCIYVGVRFE